MREREDVAKGAATVGEMRGSGGNGCGEVGGAWLFIIRWRSLGVVGTVVVVVGVDAKASSSADVSLSSIGSFTIAGCTVGSSGFGGRRVAFSVSPALETCSPFFASHL
jgi:hypothetical protein